MHRYLSKPNELHTCYLAAAAFDPFVGSPDPWDRCLLHLASCDCLFGRIDPSDVHPARVVHHFSGGNREGQSLVMSARLAPFCLGR